MQHYTLTTGFDFDEMRELSSVFQPGSAEPRGFANTLLRSLEILQTEIFWTIRFRLTIINYPEVPRVEKGQEALKESVDKMTKRTEMTKERYISSNDLFFFTLNNIHT